MPGAIPDPIRLFRITHRDNLPHVLQYGICNKTHPDASNTFTAIGNNDVIGQRMDHLVKIEGYGYVGEYVPFYFAPRSIMLYNILTGYGVSTIDPENIVFLVSSLPALVACGNRFFFTDGQANTHISGHYNQLQDLDKVDWDVVQSSNFKKYQADNDRPRRYQAEFLVHSHVPVNCIESIVTYNQACAKFVQVQLEHKTLHIPVYTDKSFYFNR